MLEEEYSHDYGFPGNAKGEIENRDALTDFILLPFSGCAMIKIYQMTAEAEVIFFMLHAGVHL